VKARVYDSIHVQVQVVELDAVRVRLGAVQLHPASERVDGLVLDDVGDDLRVLLRDPAVEARDALGARAPRGAMCGGARAAMRRRWRFDRIKYDLIYMF
jgi:hypothetical protein